MYNKTNLLLQKLLLNKQTKKVCYVNNKKVKFCSNTYFMQQFAKQNINTCFNNLTSIAFIQYALSLSNSKKHIKYALAINTSICNMFCTQNKQQTVYNAYKYYFNTLSNTTSCLNLHQRAIFKVLSNIF